MKIKEGDWVQTIKGQKKVAKVKKHVVIFDDGFAPKDRISLIYAK